MLIFEVMIFGSDKDEDVIKDAMFSGKPIHVDRAFSIDDAGKGIVGNDTDADLFPICITAGLEMVREHGVGFIATGEI